MNQETTRKFYKTLSGAEFQKKVNETKDAILLDVRTVEEFNSERIPNAININLMNGSFTNEISKLDSAKSYFVYCRSGARSATACEIMSAKGFEVYNLRDGITLWEGKVC